METEHPPQTTSRSAAAPTPLPAIRTPEQRVRVFISSTLDELAPERAAAREAITQLRLIPVLFEADACTSARASNGSQKSSGPG